jgi:hypothetical protein
MKYDSVQLGEISEAIRELLSLVMKHHELLLIIVWLV